MVDNVAFSIILRYFKLYGIDKRLKEGHAQTITLIIIFVIV